MHVSELPTPALVVPFEITIGVEATIISVRPKGVGGGRRRAEGVRDGHVGGDGDDVVDEWPVDLRGW